MKLVTATSQTAEPVPLADLAPETIARIRQQYADGVPVARIKRAHNVNDHTLYRCLDGDMPGRPRIASDPAPQNWNWRAGQHGCSRRHDRKAVAHGKA
jgi:hypothetical protein